MKRVGESLSTYNRRRNFKSTHEPRGDPQPKKDSKRHIFVIQKHMSRRPHFDLRLEIDGTLKSWAVPKGLSDIPGERRLAVQVEDHPLAYGKFEGTIPKGEYGAGTVTIWDKGTFSDHPDSQLKKALDEGHLDLHFNGRKVKGKFSLIRMSGKRGSQWLVIKGRNEPVRPDRRAIKPMMPAGYCRSRPEGWIVHPRVNGLRAIADLKGTSVTLASRQGKPLDQRFPEIVKSLRGLGVDMVLDGEISGEGASAIFNVFDLLSENGKSLRNKFLSTRLSRLANLKLERKYVRRIDQFSPHNGAMIVKNPKSIYKSGRSEDWKILKSSAANDSSIKNRDKIFFPRQKLTKGALLDYYEKMAPLLLPYLKDRPESLNRHPDGIQGKSFYQKDMKGFHPTYLRTCRISSRSSGRTTEYALIQNLDSLLYVVNLGCIEINPWLSQTSNLDRPDFLLVDLDPDGNRFVDVVEVAMATHEVLNKIGADNYCKTSGATGIHIGVPLGAKHTYELSVKLAKAVCKIVHQMFPRLTSMERSPNRRRGLIYLDYLQNRRGQTVVSPYSVRPLDGAPVSMPLTWNELRKLQSPLEYRLTNIEANKQKYQRTWGHVLGPGIDFKHCLSQIEVIYGEETGCP